MRFLIILIMIPFFGCSQKTAPVFSENDTQINVVVSDTFTVSLTSQIGTGYTWEIQEDSTGGEILKLLNKEYRESQTNADGSKGADVFTFQALKKGKTEITFAYQRPWEGKVEGAEAADRRTFVVEVE